MMQNMMQPKGSGPSGSSIPLNYSIVIGHKGEGAWRPPFYTCRNMKLLRNHSPLSVFSLAMVALMCVLPFLVPHHRNPLTTFYGEWLAVALGLAAAALLLRRASWQPFRFPVVALMPLGLMAVLGIQVATGLAVYWQQHFLVGLYLLWAALMVVLGAELRREFGLQKIVPVLAWAMLGGGLACAAIVGVQISGIDLMPYIVPRESGYGANLKQINHLADYIGLGLASLLYLGAVSRLKTGWVVLLALVLLFPLALTGQRMGWIYIVMLSVGFWWAGRNSARQSWRALWLIPAFMAMQAIIPLLPIDGAPAMATQKAVQGLQGPSIRLQFIREAWEIFLAHPWLGAGWGQFGWQDFMLAEKYPAHASWTSHAHNLIMQLLAETGIFGTLVLLAGAAYWLRGLRRNSPAPAHWWLYAGIGVLGVHALLEYPLWYAYFLGMVALLAGLAEENTLQLKLDLGPVLAGAFVVFGVFNLGNLGAHYLKLENWFTRGMTGRITAAEFDDMLDDMGTMRRKTLLTPYIDLIVARVLPDTPQFINDKRIINQQVMHYRPGDAETYNQAKLLALSGKHPEAQQQLRRAMIRHPGYADRFATQLLKPSNAATLPLVMTIVRHNRQIYGYDKAGK